MREVIDLTIFVAVLIIGVSIGLMATRRFTSQPNASSGSQEISSTIRRWSVRLLVALLAGFALTVVAAQLLSIVDALR